jgi:hypothetical protein
MDVRNILNDPVLREVVVQQLCKEEQFFRIRGDVTIVKTTPTGRKEKRLVRNLVVNTGLYHIADRLEDSPDETAMGYCAIGTNNTAPAAGDTALASEVGRVALTSKVQGTGGNANQVTYSATFPAGTGTGTIVEAGILNAAAAGIMLTRSIFAAIVKGAGDAIDVSWVLTVSAA